MALKRLEPALRFDKNSYNITPDELDMYTVYTIGLAGTAGAWWASAGTAGTAASNPLVIVNRLPDYPRNVNFSITGTATGMAGTAIINGRDQFGGTIQETIGFGSADNGGTVVGTKVFAQMTSGTLNFGTAVGNGTPRFGFVPGTDCLFGLPIKLGAATEVIHIGMNAGTGAITVNGGTVAGFVNVAMSAVRAPAVLTGTQVINVWVAPTVVNESASVAKGLTQAV